MTGRRAPQRQAGHLRKRDTTCRWSQCKLRRQCNLRTAATCQCPATASRGTATMVKLSHDVSGEEPPWGVVPGGGQPHAVFYCVAAWGSDRLVFLGTSLVVDQ